jgi:hypothetical protein
VEAAKDLLERIGNNSWTIMPKQVAGKTPQVNRILTDQPVLFETIIDAGLLLKLAQSVMEFEGEIIRIQFTGRANPLRLDTRNTATGQRWEAHLMPREPGVDDPRFVEPAEPSMSDFDRAILEAEKLAGTF